MPKPPARPAAKKPAPKPRKKALAKRSPWLPWLGGGAACLLVLLWIVNGAISAAEERRAAALAESRRKVEAKLAQVAAETERAKGTEFYGADTRAQRYASAQNPWARFDVTRDQILDGRDWRDMDPAVRKDCLTEAMAQARIGRGETVSNRDRAALATEAEAAIDGVTDFYNGLGNQNESIAEALKAARAAAR